MTREEIEIKQGLKEIHEGKVVPLCLIEKRQEIREGIALKYLQWRENDTTLQLNTTDKFLRSECFEFADEVMKQEHSQGVVIKDRRTGMSMDTRGGYNWKDTFFVIPLIKEESDGDNEVS